MTAQTRPERSVHPTALRPARRRASRRRLLGIARLAAVRGQFLVLDRVAPARSAARAMDLWCTLPDNASRRRDHRPGAGELVRVPVPRGGCAVAEHWGQGPVVYLVHGWGGWRGQLGAFVEPLVAAGYRVVALDAPGHGDADDSAVGPGRGTVQEMIEALAAVGEHFGPAHAVVAHSLGCTAAVLVAKEQLPTSRLVLVAPNHELTVYTHGFAAMLGLSERTRLALVEAIEEFCDRPLAGFDLRATGADGAMPSTLVVHDTQDKETPHAVGQGLAQAWPTASLVLTDGLGHQRILADPGVVDLVVRHVDGSTGPTDHACGEHGQ